MASIAVILRKKGPLGQHDRQSLIYNWYGHPTPEVPQKGEPPVMYSYRHSCGYRQDRPMRRSTTYQCASCQRIDKHWDEVNPAEEEPEPPNMEEIWRKEDEARALKAKLRDEAIMREYHEDKKRKAEARKRAEEEGKKAEEDQLLAEQTSKNATLEAERRKQEMEFEKEANRLKAQKEAMERQKEEAAKAKAKLEAKLRKQEEEERRKAQKASQPPGSILLEMEVVSSEKTREELYGDEDVLMAEGLEEIKEADYGSIEECLKSVVEVLHRSTLGLASYVALFNKDEVCLEYRFASEGCSKELRKGDVILSQADGQGCPAFDAVFSEEPVAALVPDVIRQPTISWLTPYKGNGDYFVAPILGLNDEVVAVLAADTIVHGPVPDVLLSADGARHIRDEEANFFEEAAGLISDKVTNIAFERLLEQADFDKSIAEFESNPQSLYQAATKAAAHLLPDANIYLSLFNQAGTICQVVAQAASTEGDVPDIVGKQLTLDRPGISFEFKESRHPQATQLPNISYIPNISTIPEAVSYTGDGLEKQRKGLAMTAIRNFKDQVNGVLYVETEPHSMADHSLDVINRIALLVSEVTHSPLKLQALTRLAAQATTYLHALLKANVYISLSNNDSSFTYLASSPGQEWLLGTILSKDEGASYQVLQEEQTLHTTSLEKHPEIKTFGKAEVPKDVEVILAPVPMAKLKQQKHLPTHGAIIGCDDIGMKGCLPQCATDVISNAQDIMGQVLGELLGYAADLLEGDSMAVEVKHGENPVRFLKVAWMEVIDEVSQISDDHFSELLDMKEPPAAVHAAVEAVLALVGDELEPSLPWETCQEILMERKAFLEAMMTMDPTDDAYSQEQFEHARELISIFSCDDMSNGLHDPTQIRYPTMIMFEWLTIAILLRDASIQLAREADLWPSISLENFHLNKDINLYRLLHPKGPLGQVSPRSTPSPDKMLNVEDKLRIESTLPPSSMGYDEDSDDEAKMEDQPIPTPVQSPLPHEATAHSPTQAVHEPERDRQERDRLEGDGQEGDGQEEDHEHEEVEVDDLAQFQLGADPRELDGEECPSPTYSDQLSMLADFKLGQEGGGDGAREEDELEEHIEEGREEEYEEEYEEGEEGEEFEEFEEEPESPSLGSPGTPYGASMQEMESFKLGADERDAEAMEEEGEIEYGDEEDEEDEEGEHMGYEEGEHEEYEEEEEYEEGEGGHSP